MRRWLALALVLATASLTAEAQVLKGGALGRPTADYAYMPAPSGCATTKLAMFLGSPATLTCLDATYTAATKTLALPYGTVTTGNLTASGLAIPVITPPVSPVLSLLTTVTVVAGASLTDGDYFTLSDGSAVVYEFDSNATVTPGRVGITFTGAESATAIRDLVIIAINGSTLEATAVAAAADTLTVTSDVAGDTMGVNSENVANAGFLVPAWSEPTHATTYGYKVVAYLPDGTSTAASAEVTTVLGHATLSAANYNAVTWGNVTGAAAYRLYRTTGGAAPPKLIYTGALLTFTDIGAAGTAETPATVGGTGVVTGDSIVSGTGSFSGAVGAFSYVITGAGQALYGGVAGASVRMPSGGVFSFSANANNGGAVVDTYLTRGGAAATLQLGAAASATPVAQTFAAQSGSGTNIAGQPRHYRGSLGTGSADPGPLVDRTGYPTSSGTTAHSESSRRYVSGRWTALTAGAATGFATLTYGASTSIGAEFFVTIRAGDGTNRQGMSYRVAVNSVRDAAGNTQSVAAVIGTPPVAAGSGTLTCTFDVAEGAGAATLRANCASSLTETFLDANFQTIANGPGLTIAPL